MDGAESERNSESDGEENPRELFCMLGYKRGHDQDLDHGGNYGYFESPLWPLVEAAVGPCRRVPYPPGRHSPLMEVFSFRLNKINNGGRHIYGEFMLDCNVNTVHCMFKREKPLVVANDEEPDKEGDELQLIAPNASSIFAADRLSFDILLMNETSIPCNGLVAWDPFRKYLYNVPLCATVKGQFGSVTVNYAVFKNPISTKVQVVVLGPQKIATNVYGRISARNSFFQSAQDRSVLFNREKASSLHVNHGDHIPLSRSIVSFPYPASLILELDLWDADNNNSVPIVNDSVEFAEPKFGSTTVMNISPNIQLNVTWGVHFLKDQAYIK